VGGRQTGDTKFARKEINAVDSFRWAQSSRWKIGKPLRNGWRRKKNCIQKRPRKSEGARRGRGKGLFLQAWLTSVKRRELG